MFALLDAYLCVLPELGSLSTWTEDSKFSKQLNEIWISLSEY